jgi:hypothetical protein
MGQNLLDFGGFEPLTYLHANDFTKGGAPIELRVVLVNHMVVMLFNVTLWKFGGLELGRWGASPIDQALVVYQPTEPGAELGAQGQLAWHSATWTIHMTRSMEKRGTSPIFVESWFLNLIIRFF